MSFNELIMVGNLGKDPELRYTPQGTPVCQFTMATNDRVKKGGEWEQHTTWFRVTVFGKQGEACSQYLTKGRQVYVMGRLRIEEWQDRDGAKRWTAEVIADRVQFLGQNPEAAREAKEGMDSDASASRGHTTQREDIPDDDIPF